MHVCIYTYVCMYQCRRGHPIPLSQRCILHKFQKFIKFPDKISFPHNLEISPYFRSIYVVCLIYLVFASAPILTMMQLRMMLYT